MTTLQLIPPTEGRLMTVDLVLGNSGRETIYPGDQAGVLGMRGNEICRSAGGISDRQHP
jgi:hypothetical protein